MAGTTVTFDGVAAPLLSVQSQKIVCIVPFGLVRPGLSTTVQAKSNGAASNAILLPVWHSSIEILTAVNADGSINSSGHPAPPGSVVTVYGAGFGQTNPPGVDGAINGSAVPKYLATIGVSVAGQDAQVVYAGPAPGQVAGIVQVNFRVPQLQPGSYPALAGWTPINQADYHGVTLWVGQP